jgi:CRP-like cAMP-binding protein
LKIIFFFYSRNLTQANTNVYLGRMHEEEIRVLGRGDYFGEQSLIKEDKRSANIIALAPGVECLTLDREAFKQLIGNLEELHSIDYGDKDRLMMRNIEKRLIQDNQQSLKGRKKNSIFSFTSILRLFLFVFVYI